MAKGLGQGEGFSFPGDLLARLPKEVEAGSVLPLRAMEYNIVRRHPGTPDALVCGPHQSASDTTLDVSARSGVGFPPIFYEAAGCLFQGSCRLHNQ